MKYTIIIAAIIAAVTAAFTLVHANTIPATTTAASTPLPVHDFGSELSRSTAYESVRGTPYNVSYDARAFIINGNRVLLQGGSIHYPRMPVEMWAGVLQQARVHGLN